MKAIEITDVHQWQPLQRFGIEHPFFSLNASTITYTWIALATLMGIVLVARILLARKKSVGRFVVTSVAQSSMNFVAQGLGTFSHQHFYFIGTLFTFILLCNLLSVIPFVEEPTQDINTTLALGVISFAYIQAWTIKTHGIVSYLKDFLSPFFVMLPLNIIGKLASIVSMSFRLFGNIFGGSIIMQILENFLSKHYLVELMALTTGLNLAVQLFFGLFESFLQAFVFAMLSLTYLSIALQKEEPEELTEVG